MAAWVFLCEEDGQSPRFMFDVRLFAESLKSKQDGIDDNMYFFASNSDAMKNLLAEKGINTDKVFHYSKFEEEMRKLNNIPFLGCVVSSHGDINGAVNIKPNQILSLIQNIPGLTDALLLLGQCYSGIFNMPRQSKVCVIGASNFCPSISANIENIGWTANVFLYFFAKWLKNPNDVDGDGQMTLLDAYKFASYHTNNALNEIKADLSRQFHIWCTEEVKKLNNLANEILNDKGNNPKDMALYKMSSMKLENLLSIYHNSQESWISDMGTALRLIL